MWRQHFNAILALQGGVAGVRLTMAGQLAPGGLLAAGPQLAARWQEAAGMWYAREGQFVVGREVMGSAPNSPRPERRVPRQRANSIAAPEETPVNEWPFIGVWVPAEAEEEEEEGLPAPNVYRPGLWHDDEEDDSDEGMVDDDMVEDDSDIIMYPMHQSPTQPYDEGLGPDEA